MGRNWVFWCYPSKLLKITYSHFLKLHLYYKLSKCTKPKFGHIYANSKWLILTLCYIATHIELYIWFLSACRQLSPTRWNNLPITKTSSRSMVSYTLWQCSFLWQLSDLVPSELFSFYFIRSFLDEEQQRSIWGFFFSFWEAYYHFICW